MLVYRLDDGGQEQEELGIFLGGFARIQEIQAGIGGKGPVVVLAGPVDPGEGLFVQEANQTMPVRNLLHGFHGELVVVGGGVDVGVNGGQLMLGRSGFVVLGLGMPSFQSSRSNSAMKAVMRDLMAP